MEYIDAFRTIARINNDYFPLQL